MLIQTVAWIDFMYILCSWILAGEGRHVIGNPIYLEPKDDNLGTFYWSILISWDRCLFQEHMFLKLCSIMCNIFMVADNCWITADNCKYLEGADVEPLSSHFKGVKGMSFNSKVTRTNYFKNYFWIFFGVFYVDSLLTIEECYSSKKEWGHSLIVSTKNQ